MVSKKRNTFLGWFRDLLNRYRKPGLVAIAVTAAVLLVASNFFPQVENFITKNKVLPIVTLLILIDVAIAFDGYRGDRSVTIVENQDECFDELVPAVAKSTKADLLEYAASTTLPLIREIERQRIPLRILIQHPENVDGIQKQRCLSVLDTLYNSVFENYTGEFEIRCYRLPYSLRGRHLHGSLLELGWLTPNYKRDSAYGHQNPSNLVMLPNTSHDYLRDFFERTFEDYWTHPDTVPATEVLAALQLSDVEPLQLST